MITPFSRYLGQPLIVSFQSNAVDCKSVYMSSNLILASKLFNDLRHSLSPSALFLKQVLKLSRFGLASFHAVSCLLCAGCQLSLPDRPAVFF